MWIREGVSEPWLPRDASHRWLEVTGDEFEDGRLAGAVTTDDAPPFARGDGERDVLKEFGRAEGDADVGKRE